MSNMVRFLVSVPRSIKAKLDAERQNGVTGSGLIRRLLVQHFKNQRRKPAA